MALAVTSAPTEELLTLEEGSRHLRVFSSELNSEVQNCIRDARDYCERWTQRTLRSAVTRTLKLDSWWCDELRLPWPPLLATPALAVTYYDADNVSQTLSSANYVVEYSTDGGGRIVWATDATIPTVYDRPDAVTVTFSTGYADLASLPPIAVRAIKVKMTELWGNGSEGEIEAARKSADRLLGLVDWSGYA